MRAARNRVSSAVCWPSRKSLLIVLAGRLPRSHRAGRLVEQTACAVRQSAVQLKRSRPALTSLPPSIPVRAPRAASLGLRQVSSSIDRQALHALLCTGRFREDEGGTPSVGSTGRERVATGQSIERPARPP